MLLYRVFNIRFYLIGIPAVHTTEYATKVVFNHVMNAAVELKRRLIIWICTFMSIDSIVDYIYNALS